MVYGLLTTFAYGIYAIITDTIKLQQTSNVDEKLAGLGPGNKNILFYHIFA